MDIRLEATLKPFAYGIAVQDIEYGSNLLHVKVLDHLPQMNGEVSSGIEKVTARVKTPRGVVERTALFTDYVEATWLNRNSNQVTAPDIMKNMRVLLWRDGDSEKYYWEAYDRDEALKTVEHVIFAFSNTNLADRTNKELTLENCYILEFDTRHKRIGLYTNKNDGEPFAYSIKLDTAAGNYKINDDVGNFVLLDSAKTLIELHNADDSFYKLDKQDIHEHCLGNRLVEVGGDNVVKIGGASTTTVGRSFHVDSGDFGVKTNNFVTKASKVGFDSPVSNFSGAVNMASFAAGGKPGTGSPPIGGAGYIGVIDGDILITKAATTDVLNANTINASNITCDQIDATQGNFSSHGPHA